LVRFDPYIPAGGQGEILIQLETNRLNGKFERYLTVISNDPKNQKVLIRLHGHAPEFLKSTPSDHF
jgi:hypothetical protein